jgi:hypothetical protein
VQSDINISKRQVCRFASAAETKQIVIKEIRAKWGKFSEDDLSSLKNKDDLVTQRAAKYGLEKSLAKRDVDALTNGRQF